MVLGLTSHITVRGLSDDLSVAIQVAGELYDLCPAQKDLTYVLAQARRGEGDFPHEMY